MKKKTGPEFIIRPELKRTCTKKNELVSYVVHQQQAASCNLTKGIFSFTSIHPPRRLASSNSLWALMPQQQRSDAATQ